MYNEKLDKLIEMALMDGELSEKEKQVLFKNAETIGIDLDEFEMVLEAKLFEKQKSMDQEKPKTKEAAPKSDKFGDVKKCPACGSMVQSFQIKCIDCDHEFSNIESSASINKLFEMLNAAEESRSESSFLRDVFSGINGSKVDQKKMTIISNFPIPNTKEDIIEFLSLAVPKAKAPSRWSSSPDQQEMAKVWRQKCAQIIMKARFSMKEDKETLGEINSYAKGLKIK